MEDVELGIRSLINKEQDKNRGRNGKLCSKFNIENKRSFE